MIGALIVFAWWSTRSRKEILDIIPTPQTNPVLNDIKHNLDNGRNGLSPEMRALLADVAVAPGSTLSTSMDKPCMWIFAVPERNSRRWISFGSRATRSYNLPWLNLCISSIYIHNCNDFNVIFVNESTIMRLCPEIASTIFADWIEYDQQIVDVIKYTILARFGGIWVDPATICFRSLAPIWQETLQRPAVFIGCSSRQHRGLMATTEPALSVVAAKPGAAPIEFVRSQLTDIFANPNIGGYLFRETETVMVKRAILRHPQDVTMITAEIGGNRTIYGELIGAKELASTNPTSFANPGVLHFYVIDRDELTRSVAYGWINRLDEYQLLYSDGSGSEGGRTWLSHLFRHAIPDWRNRIKWREYDSPIPISAAPAIPDAYRKTNEIVFWHGF
jgi:hypothetical protein